MKAIYVEGHNWNTTLQPNTETKDLKSETRKLIFVFLWAK